MACLWRVTQFGSGQHRQETQHRPVTYSLSGRKLFRASTRTVPGQGLDSFRGPSRIHEFFQPRQPRQWRCSAAVRSLRSSISFFSPQVGSVCGQSWPALPTSVVYLPFTTKNGTPST